MKVFTGCCGFPVSRKRYYGMYDAVELQDTFYNPPDPEKLKKLRDEAPSSFRFTMKAWQAITHPPNMRTWRRSKVSIPKEEWSYYGFLRPTEQNFRAWEAIDEGANALKADIVIVQLPPSFGCSEENLSNIKDFFSSISKPEYWVGIELRGTWVNCSELIKEVVSEFDFLIHVTDPFKWLPATSKEVGYFRLHGIGPKEVNYRYKYSDDDLKRLLNIISSLEGLETVYVMFNNVYMRDDALRFRALSGRALSP